MGEYAKRLSDGQRVKIGTCTAMYYCRYEQRNEIDYGYETKGLSWRIPAFEEDGIQPGDYEYGGLVKEKFPLYSTRLQDYEKRFLELELDKTVGITQVRIDKLGMLINVPCYHGLRLPEAEGFKCFWNGKQDAMQLESLENAEEDLMVNIRCMACRKSWSCTFDEIAPFIMSLRMLLRLYKQCNEYLHKDDEPFKYKIDKWEHSKFVGGGGRDIHTLHLEDRIDDNGKREWTAIVEKKMFRGKDTTESFTSNSFYEVKKWIASEMGLEFEWSYKRQ